MNPAPPPRRRGRAALIHGALLAVGMAIWFYPLLVSGAARLPGNPTDPRHLNWVMEWHYLCVTGDALCESWLSPPVFHPLRETLATTDLLLGQLAFYLPARLAGLAPELAQQATVALLLVLAYVSSVWFSTAVLGAPPGAAAIGAFLFTFGAPRTAQIDHPQLAAFFALPLVVGGIALALGIGTSSEAPGTPERSVARELSRPPQSSGWLLAAAALAWLLSASANLAWLFLFWLCLAFVAALTSPEGRSAITAAFRRDIVTIAGAGALLLAVAVPLVRLYATARERFGAASDFGEQLAPLLPRPFSWLRLGKGSLERTLLPDVGGDLASRWEHNLGIGWLALLLCLLGATLVRRDPWGRAMALATGAAIALVTSWPGGFEPWRAVHALVPGAESVRAVGRIALVLLLPASLALVALGREAQRRGLSKIVVGACALLLIAEQVRAVSSRSRDLEQARVNRIVSAIPEPCEAFFSSIEGQPGPSARQHVHAMWAAFASGKPTLNGYTSYPPRDWPLWRTRLSSPEEIEWQRQALSAWIGEQDLAGRSICWVRERELAGARGEVEVEELTATAREPSSPVLP